jgi:PAS domain S-box-containing protein
MIVGREEWNNSHVIESVINSMPYGFSLCKIIYDDSDKPIDYIFVDVNQKFESFTGFKNADIIGSRFFDFKPDDIQLVLKEEILNNLLQNGHWKGDLALVSKTRGRFLTHEHLFIIKDDTNKPSWIANIVQDISEQNEDQIDHTKAHAELQQAEKLEILNRVSGGIGHELRNPLGAMKNAVYYLRMTLDDSGEDVKEMLDILDTEISASDMIISSLLAYSRPKAPVLKKANISELVDAALSRVTRNNNVQINIDVEPTLPPVMVDSLQITRAIMNLVKNAIQSMPTGGVLTIRGQPSGDDKISLSLSDTGIGISEANMQFLFEPLYTTKANGIGLGLVIAKNFVENHNGTLQVESQEGAGSVFTITLPSSQMEVK